MAENGRGNRALVDRLLSLEARQDELTARLAEAPADIPDLHPHFTGIYRQKVERITEALQRPEERDEAAAAIRDIIERITLSPGPGRGVIDATLHGDFRTILEWTHRQKNKTDTPGLGVSVSVVAEARNHRNLPIDILAMFSRSIIQPFDAAA